MEEMVISFFDTFTVAARISMDKRQIYFNLKMLLIMAMEEDMTFNECFTMCMSHELIHQILFDFVSAHAYNTFNNICYKKHKNMKAWIGGVGCE